MKARVRPSASWTRRRIISQESSEFVSSSPLSLRMAAAGWPFGTSNTAVTCPCSTPWRTRPASPRPPSASAKASSKMDLPAPVSPVSTARPRENSMSSRSIRTMSRIERRASMKERFLPEAYLPEGPGNVGPLILARLETVGLYKIIGVLVPAAIRKIVAEHRSGGLRLADDPDRHVGLGKPGQRFLDMPRGLVLGDHGFEAVDGGGVVALFHVIAADIHFLTGELVAGALELGLGADGIFGSRIFADHLFQRGDRLFGTALVAAGIRDLVVLRGRDQELGIGGIGAARVQGDITGRRADAIIVVAGVVIGIGRHQQRFTRPFGIGMLAIDFLEFLRRGLRIALLVQQVQALIIELVRGLLDEGGILLGKLVPQGPRSASAQGDGEKGEPRSQAQRATQPMEIQVQDMPVQD